MKLKSDAKFGEELTCHIKIDMRNLTNFDLEYSKASKIYISMSSCWPKYIMYDLKKYRRVVFDSTVDWCKMWRKTDLCFQKWHEEFGKLSKPEKWRFHLESKMAESFRKRKHVLWFQKVRKTSEKEKRRNPFSVASSLKVRGKEIAGKTQTRNRRSYKS